MSNNILNPVLYKRAKITADEKYKRSGLYKSAFIQKEYQRLGGKYKGNKIDNNQGIQRWLKNEEWVEVEPYLKNNEIVKCGTSKKKGKACRPLIKFNSKTPITLPELIKIHGKKKLLTIVSLKQKDMNGRINWGKGTFTKSK